MRGHLLTILSLLALLPTASSWGQPGAAEAGAGQPPPAPSRDSPRPDQLEPGVDTSATPSDEAAARSTPGSQSGDAAAASRARRSAKPAPARAASPDAAQVSPNGVTAAQPSASAAKQAVPKSALPEAGAKSTPPEAGRPAAANGARAASGKAQDRIELDTTQITGNRELPKVLYIVPWKRSDLGDLVGKPPNSLLDEVLSPVDRDVFKRENRYYEALKPDTGAAPAAAGASAPAEGGPKP